MINCTQNKRMIFYHIICDVRDQIEQQTTEDIYTLTRSMARLGPTDNVVWCTTSQMMRIYHDN